MPGRGVGGSQFGERVVCDMNVMAPTFEIEDDRKTTSKVEPAPCANHKDVAALWQVERDNAHRGFNLSGRRQCVDACVEGRLPLRSQQRVSALRMIERAHSRRAFLIGAGAFAVGAGLDAFALEPNWPEVSRHDVPVGGLPQRLDGFTIAQISDAHLKRLGVVEEAIARVVQNESIQLVVLSGDIVDSLLSLNLLQEFCVELRKGGTVVVATLGNWEHWANLRLSDLSRAYASIGAQLLVNEAAVLSDGVRVYASDDSTGGTPRVGSLYDDSRAPTLLVTHSPAFLDTAAFSRGAFSLALPVTHMAVRCALVQRAFRFVRSVAGGSSADGTTRVVVELT